MKHMCVSPVAAPASPRWRGFEFIVNYRRCMRARQEPQPPCLLVCRVELDRACEAVVSGKTCRCADVQTFNRPDVQTFRRPQDSNTPHKPYFDLVPKKPLPTHISTTTSPPSPHPLGTVPTSTVSRYLLLQPARRSVKHGERHAPTAGVLVACACSRLHSEFVTGSGAVQC